MVYSKSNPYADLELGIKHNPHFHRQWQQLYDTAEDGVHTLLRNVRKLRQQVNVYGTVQDSHDYRRAVNQLKMDTVQLVTKTNVEIINLAKRTDEQWEGTASSSSCPSEEMVEKKKLEMQLSREFKDALQEFQDVQKHAALMAKKFVLRARAASLKKTASRQASELKLPTPQQGTPATRSPLLPHHHQLRPTSETSVDASQQQQSSDLEGTSIAVPTKRPTFEAHDLNVVTEESLFDEDQQLDRALDAMDESMCLHLMEERAEDLQRLEEDMSKVNHVLTAVHTLSDGLHSKVAYLELQSTKKEKLEKEEKRVRLITMLGFVLLAVIIVVVILH